MTAKKILPCLFLVGLGFIGFTRVSHSETKEQFEKDRLKARAVAFWTAWQNNVDNRQLASFVLPEDRKDFINIERFKLLSFQVDSIELEGDLKTGVAHSKIKRMFPMTSNVIDWVIENQWVFYEGEWYIHYVPPKAIDLFKMSSPAAEVPKAIVFEGTNHDFGAVPAGSRLHYEFIFENRGLTAVRLSNVLASCFLGNSSSKCLLARSPVSTFPPGAKGKIEAEWLDSSAPRVLDEPIHVDFSNGQSFELHFRADIKAPPKQNP